VKVLHFLFICKLVCSKLCPNFSKMRNIKKLVLLAALSFYGQLIFAQNPDSASAVKKADKWVKSRAWAKGLQITADPSINSLEFEKQYESNPALWDKAFQFLNDSKLKMLAPGKYPIAGTDAFAMVSEGVANPQDKVKWESHRKYIDLQHVISGKIKLGVAAISSATVTTPYDESKDAANYNANGTYYIATPKEFFLFFPQNVHRPDIKVEGYDTFKKVVIKIPYHSQ
jgi:biofilm protein TabA